MTDCLCVKRADSILEGAGGIAVAKLSAIAAIRTNIVGVGSIKATMIRERGAAASPTAEANLYWKGKTGRGIIGSIGVRVGPKLAADIVLGGLWHPPDFFLSYGPYSEVPEVTHLGSFFTMTAEGDINHGLSVSNNLDISLIGSGNLLIPFTDKFAGPFADFGCVQKQYPISDITNINFVTEQNKLENLYQSIDEGLFTGNYHTHGLVSDRISDDKTTYIQPSSVQTEGTFLYKCQITKPTITGKHSRVFFRAAAPLKNYDADIPAEYTITNIKIEDPGGGLIAYYKDIKLKGDANFDDPDGYVNFATYATEPEVNKLELYQWQSGYPDMEQSTGYSLTFQVLAQSFDDPFDDGFDIGFEENSDVYESFSDDGDYLALEGAPLSTQGQRYLNPSNSIRISAVEICNSGSTAGLLKEQYVPIFLEVRPSGDSLERRLRPTQFLLNSFDSGIFPLASSIWELPSTSKNNTTLAGADSLLNALAYLDDDYYVRLDSVDSEHLADSGKLMLKFGLSNPEEVLFTRRGEFGFGHTKKEFNVGDKKEVDTFFTVNRATLRVRAKKEAGTRDYALDVVGWSDDKLLHVTPAVGGFLQNEEGVGDYPVSSGFNTTDYLAFDGEPMSDQDQFYSGILPNNAGGDHYVLSTVPVVTGTTFEWYEIPLRIYEDNVDLGKSIDYSMSSYFEHLYLDIHPLPSGAQVSYIELCLKYSPSTAVKLHTIGSETIGHITSERSEGRIYPTSRQSGDSVINAGSGFAPLSTIESIPHAFTTPDSIKTNYSRRWRGINGLVNGPFDPNMFGFGYENPQLDYPFTSGFFDFADATNGVATISSKTLGDGLVPLTGTISTTYTDYLFKNVGWRFKDQDIFTNEKPGWTSNYKTTDWTSLTNGAENFTDHELYGQIADAFDTVIRISGHNSSVNFGAASLNDAFAVYTRFAPDISVSGASPSFNGFSSGVLVSKWDAGEDLEFALGYEGGYLCGFANTNAGDLVKVKDTVPYSGYQFPLSVMLTYNDNDSQKLRLYADNEISGYWNPGSWDTLRATSATFTRNTGTSNLVLGYSSGSGVGMNMFVSEFGVSNSGNVVYSDADLLYKEVVADKFLENTRVKFWEPDESYTNDSYKLWDRIDETTLDWDLGAFKHCQFGVGYDGWTKRSGRDSISFNLNHAGSGYSQYATKTMPATVDSDLAYHTQIENDFLRFNLSDASDNFYAVAPRISKSLPRGYDFSERAMVVETVLSHTSDTDISWSGGKVGPKLIVSLYTKNQEPASYATTNYGLINRSIHYLESGCIYRLDSTFDFNNFVDESEQWALFPYTRRLTEFNHKYYSKDIDDMFLQYDLVYPSGGAFKSRIDIHTAHVRLDNAFVSASPHSGTLPVYMSGELRARDSVSLHMVSIDSVTNLSGINHLGQWEAIPNGLSLHTKYDPTQTTANVSLHTEGLKYTTASMPLSLRNLGIIDSTIGSYSGVSISTSGGLPVGTGNMPLVTYQVDSMTPSSGSLPLFSFASTVGSLGSFAVSPLYLYSTPTGRTVGYSSGSMPLNTIGLGAPFDSLPEASMSLFVRAPHTPSSILNLYTFSQNVPVVMSGTLGLHTVSTRLTSGLASFYWTNKNAGSPIDVDDNLGDVLFAKADNDEIRGVDLICFADCSIGGCTEKALVTHDTTWREPECVDGGIFRAKATYTNLDYSYSGDFYGIRKFTGLEPGTRYDITIKGKTGNDKGLVPPREWEEWEYGSTDTINFSGFKLIGDHPYATSGRNDSVNDSYGRAVSIKGDLMLVGAPNHHWNAEGSGWLPNAGAAFAYRRITPTNSGGKYFWDFEQKIVLPSGFRSDSYAHKGDVSFFDGLPAIPKRKWNVGQEGRQFGSSLAVCSSGAREIAVVGAPNAEFSRDFDSDVVTRDVPILAIVVTDEFKTDDTLTSLAANIYNIIHTNNNLYKYYAETPAKLSMKLLICDAPPHTDGDKGHDFLTHAKIDRNNVGGATTLEIFSGIQDGFLKAYPYDTSKPFNNIPVLMGVFIDPTPSFGRKSVEPAIDHFIQYYKDYGAVSGVTDVNGVADSGGVYEYRLTGEEEDPEDWIEISNRLLGGLLDTGRLIDENEMRFITTEIGSEHVNTDLEAFNTVPDSGGRVYVFERESGIWNLIQEIKSPSESTLHPPDRFGHAVDISYNSDVITIGSPYIEEACSVYEHKPDERKKMYETIYAWVVENSERLDSDYGAYYSSGVLENFNDYERAYGAAVARERTYHELNPTEKFNLRIDKDINEYKKIYRYNYSDINYTGSWGFIPAMEAGTSRLGWSTSTNEDGSIVAFGAPTDSLNEFDDSNVFYRKGGFYGFGDEPPAAHVASDGWASTCNAGAVRLFQSRKYFPHSGVVEYFKFGNLDRNSHPSERDDGKYETIKDAFTDRPFTRTQFVDVDIPKDAGLAFIITPEVDAASDEILQNIKDWLSLGDRTLVLVGNDPVWEQDGIYEKSNVVINKILSSLGSRMRLRPARNKYESLPSCSASGVPNAISSRNPRYTRQTAITRADMYAKGVADIRMEFPEWNDLLSAAKMSEYYNTNCDDENPTCVLPLSSTGDLRAQKQAKLAKEVNLGLVEVIENFTWGFQFGNGNAGADFPVPPPQLVNKPNKEPKPVIAAAEYSPEIINILPAWEEKKLVPIYNTRIIKKNVEKTTYTFDDNHFSNSSFILSDPTVAGFTHVGIAKYINPDPYLDRDAVRQALGTTKTKVKTEEKKVSNTSVYVAEQEISTETEGLNSRVVMIAGLTPERKENILAGADDNVLFYLNLVRQACPLDDAYILQLGGWTGRNSFKAAYDKSHLKEFFASKGVEVSENHTGHLYSRNNICWIANPNGQPSDSEIQAILGWLGTGNKTLVMTYDETQDSARNMFKLCSSLNIAIKPLYLNGRSKFASNVDDLFPSVTNGNQTLSYNNPIIKGCSERGRVGKLYLRYDEYMRNSDEFNTFTPIEFDKDDTSTSKVVDYALPIGDDIVVSDTFWQIKSGVAKMSIPTVAGSGYRLFFSWVSEDGTENHPIRLVSNNVSLSPDLRDKLSDTLNPPLNDYDDDDNPFTVAENVQYTRSLERTGRGDIASGHVDIRSPVELLGNMDWYLDANNLRAGDPKEIDYRPKTTRLVALSGAMLPINKEVKVTVKEYEETYLVGYKEVITIHPEVVTIIPPKLREIETDDSKYCPDNTTVCTATGIADGPVIVAEEPELFSPFRSGRERSRIVLLSDSSLVQQGICEDHYFTLNAGFIKSLYPKSLDALRDNVNNMSQDINPSPSEGTNSTIESLVNVDGGRQFAFWQKIIAPEQGSPQRFYSASGMSALTSRFGSSNSQRQESGVFMGYNMVNPDNVDRPAPPETEKKRKKERGIFRSRAHSFAGAYVKFSGVFDGVKYSDATAGGGLPDLIKYHGVDYLDTEYFASGYPGDLFGYSIGLQNNQIIVGAPYNAYDSSGVIYWDTDVSYDKQDNVSGIKLGGKGGAGAAFYFERTNLGIDARGTLTPWEFKQKIKPISSIDVGFDGHGSVTSLSEFNAHYGSNDYTVTDIADSIMPDQFGESVSIDADFVAIGAPGHDFENYHEHIYATGAFLRKEFDGEFDIPLHNVYDLGASGLRSYDLSGSGQVVLNNGAVYTFENRVIDWPRFIKEWTFAEKIIPQGYKSRLQKDYDGVTAVSGSENDHFGKAVSIDRARRTDGDYTLAVGSPSHMFSTSGEHPYSDEIVYKAGAAYTYDAMLRGQPPQSGSPDAFIDSNVFGNSGYKVNLLVEQTQPSVNYVSSGVVYTNLQGELFIEASGRDSATMGFIQHRPYIESVVGTHPSGELVFASLPLHTEGLVPVSSGDMNMYLSGPSMAKVYNTVNLYVDSQYRSSGTLNLTTAGVTGVTIGSGLNLYTSGTILASDNLNLNVRGK
jgi:hypothetical protein